MKIAIIGGGIAGLSTALALTQQGHQVQVLERAAKILPLGAGIWLAPNALKVLAWLGLKEPIFTAGAKLKRVEITDQHLKALGSAPEPDALEAIPYTLAIHRADLQEILAQALPAGVLTLGRTYRRHEQDENEVRLWLQEETEPVKVDLLIGADGLRSALREDLFPGAPLRYSGQTCWRGIAQMELPEELRASGKEAWGPGLRFGLSDLGSGRVYWFAVANAPQGEQDLPTQRREYLLDRFSGFHLAIQDLIMATPTETILRHDLSDLKPLSKWSIGRVGLIGDAAHATTPNLGQGAAQGIEDAFALANILNQDEPVTTLLQKFEKQRRPKALNVVRTSWQMGRMIHHRWGQPFLKLMMSMTPERVVTRQLAALYAVQGYSPAILPSSSPAHN